MGLPAVGAAMWTLTGCPNLRALDLDGLAFNHLLETWNKCCTYGTICLSRWLFQLSRLHQAAGRGANLGWRQEDVYFV